MGCTIPVLKDVMWGNAYRRDLPDDFLPHDVHPSDNPAWMIYDIDGCDMPENIAQLLPKAESRSAQNDREDGSRKLCNMLRHGARGRITLNRGDLTPAQKSDDFLYTITTENDKQRFQLAVLTTLITGDHSN
eukprot:9723562-Heterocapsa_arctica.AAC.1